MPSLQNLPLETLEYVFLFLETTEDLLHTALACKSFYEMIIPTYHLHFANISCSVPDTSPAFWEKLSTSPRSRSMIRQLELCYSCFFPNSSRMQRPGLRIDEEFVSRWTNMKLSSPVELDLDSQERANFRNLMQCLEGLNRCRSIVLVEEPMTEEEFNDVLASIAANLSGNLQSLVVSCFTFERSEDYVPLYTPSNFSFSCLTRFDVQLNVSDNYLHTSIKLMLDSVVFTCSTVVNFAFHLDHEQANMRFIYFPLMKHAHWSSLKTLELGGNVQLFDPQESNTDTYVSFLARNSQIEYLRFGVFDDNQVQTLQTHIPPDILPHLQALDSEFPLHPDILTRAQHISNFQIYPPEIFSLTKSLRSCTIWTDGARQSIIEEIVESIPQLERLCVRVSSCSSLGDCSDSECRCIFKYDPYRITGLHNLQHLGLLGVLLPDDDMVPVWKHLITGLPRLSSIYKYANVDKPMLYRVIRSPGGDGSYELVPSQKSEGFDSPWDFPEEDID